MESLCREIAREMLEKGLDAQSAKTLVCRRRRAARMPSNIELLSHLSGEEERILKPLLRRKPVRTISGVAVVAVMTSPSPCPHGRCVYCPRGDDAPQSYTGFEPAALRAREAGYDPYLQVMRRLGQLAAAGHSVEKAELIIMGGTFTARERSYQEWFVRRCFDAMSSFGSERPFSSTSIADAHSKNEGARVRNVGLTIETRPDFCSEEHVDWMLKLGATRVEIGVQSLSNRVLRKVGRGHVLEHVVSATRIARDSGLKVCYHMMPGLFATPEQDLEMFRRLFHSPELRPDMIKIYPTLVLKGTELYRLWRRGEFTPLSTVEAVELLAQVKMLLPRWVRTMRIQRDIPSQLIEAGVRRGDLAMLVERELERRGGRCRCIRCREAGHLLYKKGFTATSLRLFQEEYEASKGVERFISLEDEDREALLGYLRLRIPSEDAHRLELREGAALVRELKVVGEALPLGAKGTVPWQHRGAGSTLLSAAEEAARELGMERLVVLSAVGAREYYRKKGYELDGVYMVKRL